MEKNSMNIVTTTGVLPPSYPSEMALERLAASGFPCLDMAFDYCVAPDFPFMSDDWRDWAKNLKAQADALGVRYSHAHSSGNAASRDTAALRCFEACRLLGSKYLVIHPIVSVDKVTIKDNEECIRINAEAIRELLPYAEENNVIILSENLLWGSSIDPLVIADLVKAVDSKYFGWCFDTGHAHCSGIPISELRGVSVVPLSLHIQDNHGKGSGDEHLLPGDGTIDWKEFLDILKEIDYQGDVVLEAHHQSIDAPDEEREAIFAELLRRAKRIKDYLSE
jgi:sugar phosphate isomerase/epimerase